MRVLVLGHRDVLDALSPQGCADAMAAVLAGQAVASRSCRCGR